MGQFLEALRVATLLALTDIKMLYRRSSLGPLWVTLTLGAQIAVIGLLFSTLFSVDRFSYFLYFGVGLTFWLFLTSTINEGAASLVNSGSLIRQVALPVSTHVLRVILKNLFILGHNFLILIPLFFLSSDSISFGTLLVFPSLLLVIANLVWIALAAAILSARYRDLPPVINGFIVIAFYATPILWKPDQFEGSLVFSLIPLNPFFHLVEIFRQPLLGFPVPWQSVLALLVATLVGFGIVRLLRAKMERNVPFWV